MKNYYDKAIYNMFKTSTLTMKTTISFYLHFNINSSIIKTFANNIAYFDVTNELITF
jgi:hypothetical protein